VGQKRDYRLEPCPRATGTHAEVYGANRVSDGRFVAFKQSHPFEEARRRLKREIELLRYLRHPHVIELLDWDDKFEWSVMPFAQGSLEDLRPALSAAGIKRAIEQAARGLAFGHDEGFVHREVTPRCIFSMRGEGDERHWVVAKWGRARKPGPPLSLGTMTVPFDTGGFESPEVRAGRRPSRKSDVYSLGRVAAWAVTGTWPVSGIPLIPPGPWRVFVRETTESEPEDRPQDMRAVLRLLRRVEPESDCVLPDGTLETLKRASEGDPLALLDSTSASVSHPGDFPAYARFVSRMEDEQIRFLIRESPEKLAALARNALAILGGDWSRLPHELADDLLCWFPRAAACAVDLRQIPLLVDLCTEWFPVEIAWNRWEPLRCSRAFLRSLQGEAAMAVSVVLAMTDRASSYWRPSESWSGADERILQALVDSSKR